MSSTAPNAPTGPVYPVAMIIDYPDRNLDRVTSFFRIFTAAPILFLAALLAQALPPLLNFPNNNEYRTNNTDWNNFVAWATSGGLNYPSLMALLAAIALLLAPVIAFAGGFVLNLFNPIVLMLVFRRKYPKWWFDFYVMLVKFITRVLSYVTLLSDVYPSTDEDQNVHMNIPYPDAQKDLSQGLPLIKWFLAIPHYVVLGFLGIAAVFSDVVIWFAILFTGRTPKSLFDFMVGYYRWGFRVYSYAFLHFTDKYPPFSLQ